MEASLDSEGGCFNDEGARVRLESGPIYVLDKKAVLNRIEERARERVEEASVEFSRREYTRAFEGGRDAGIFDL